MAFELQVGQTGPRPAQSCCPGPELRVIAGEGFSCVNSFASKIQLSMSRTKRRGEITQQTLWCSAISSIIFDEQSGRLKMFRCVELLE